MQCKNIKLNLKFNIASTSQTYDTVLNDSKKDTKKKVE